jgi:hypothetical protein
MRIWLHEVTGNEFGWNAWALQLMGFATWAATEPEVLRRVPAKLEEHLRWLRRHGLPAPELPAGIEVVQRVAGNEVLFDADIAAAPPDMVTETIDLMHAARSDLLATVESLPDVVLDWEPPYRAFAPWADWRTIRQILVHIAQTETRYYLTSIGHEPGMTCEGGGGDWRPFLSEERAAALAFLEDLKSAPDRARVRPRGEEQWSVRKVLRRLIRHELLHWKSIKRIVGEFEACGDQESVRGGMPN